MFSTVKAWAGIGSCFPTSFDLTPLALVSETADLIRITPNPTRKRGIAGGTSLTRRVTIVSE
jgi:hypothetical protein